MAVRFDADGEDYTRALALGTQTALTVSCWFKVSVDRDTWSTVFSIDNGTDDNWCLQSGADGTTVATVFDASTQEGMGSVTVGTWYYVCLATSGTTGTLYYKAATAAALTAQAVTSVTASVNAATLRIGESPWGGEWLNGCVADLKFWTTQLTAAEADLESRQYLPRRLTNLQAFYPLVKPETTDYSGNARTLSGGTGATREDGPPIPWTGTAPQIILPAAATGVTLDGTSTAAASAAGSLAVARPLTGTASAANSATGSLSVTRPLDGTSSAASGVSGGLGVARPLDGQSHAAASATGQFHRAAGLTGISAAAAGVSGAMAVDRPLAGAAPASASASGDLTTQGQVDLAGVAAAASSATGVLTVARAFTGSSETAADFTGALAVARPLTAVVSAAASASGDLTAGSGTFVCQDFTTAVSVDTYSATVTVDAYAATTSVDAYGATFTVDAYSGTATICGR